MNFELVKQNAKHLLSLYGYHDHIVMIFPQNKPMIIMKLCWSMDDEQQEIFKKINEILDEVQADYYICILNACKRDFTNINDLQYALENLDTERPSVYPENMRTEVLLIQERHRNGLEKFCIIEYQKNNEQIKFINEHNINHKNATYNTFFEFNVNIV